MRCRVPAGALKATCGTFHGSGTWGNAVVSLQHSAGHLNGAKPRGDLKGCPSSINTMVGEIGAHS